MKSAIGCMIGLVFGVSVSAEPLLEGWVRLESGEPVADAQVRLFDLTDLQQGAIARALSDGTGYFALPLAALTGQALPARFALGPNYPNPFNPSTIIPYQLAALSQVRLEVFNLLGQHIVTLVDGERPAGFHTATWTATDAAGRAVGAGVYIYRLIGGGQTMSRRMVLVDGQAGAPRGETGVERLSPVISSWAVDSRVYRLTVSGQGLVPYVDPTFRAEAGMAPVELVVETRGLEPANKATDDATPVTIPDANLRAAIAAALRTGSPTITKGEMTTLVRLEAPDAGISDLTGLEFATNLTDLWLSNNQITDLSPLSDLTNLTSLDFYNNQITDLSPFADLTNLIGLYLDNNQITDLSPLAGLTNLKRLGLSGNQITDLSPFADLTNLIGLYLDNNQITDLSPLAGLTNLKRLELSKNPLSASSINNHIPALQNRGVTVEFDSTPSTIDDLTPVTIPDTRLRAAIATALGKADGATMTKSEMETLTSLEAQYAGISDLTGLEFATNLTNLRLNKNYITNLWALSGLTNLTHLWLEHNQITDLSPLSDLTNLTYLYLSNNQVADLSPLAGLTNLTLLGLNENNQITDLSTLADLTNLRYLWLENNNISDISVLSGLTNLTYLYFSNNQITDLSPLSDLTNLTHLYFSNNQITDLSPLSDLTNLTHLWLNNNNISELASLSGLINLRYLWLNNNNITDISVLLGLTNLIELNLKGNLPKFDSTASTIDDPTPVSIPDANLRAAIAEELDKASGTTITKGEMETLAFLEALDVDISDLTGLEFATNLTHLWLYNKNISDISALSGLTNLKDLWLSDNNITDISALSGLFNLTHLWLNNNNITDISALSGLINLEDLQLKSNNISDISPLSGLTNLKNLDLAGQPLSVSSINDHIPALERSSAIVRVNFDPPFRESDFDIELVFLDDHFTEKHKRIIRYAARRWMSIIREDLPDYTFANGGSGKCGGQLYEIPSGERIDDLRIYVVGRDLPDNIAGLGGPRQVRETHLAIVGCVQFDLEGGFDWFLRVALHEIGHVLGIGTTWDNFIQNSSGDTHFSGPRAIAAFDDAGGRDYTGAKVPVEENGGHWRASVIKGELMRAKGSGEALSAITIQALADLGWVVDVTQANPYTLPSVAVAKASAKVAAPSTHAEPEWSCGVGQEQEPIYVVDPQGRIVRTISP